MTDTKPTLEAVRLAESADSYEHSYNAMFQHAVKCERELAAIKSQQVPEEPESVQYLRECVVARTRGESTLQYIDTLQSALKVAQQERDAEKEIVLKAVKQICTPMSENIKGWKERAEKAEASNKRLVELLKEAQKTVNDMRSEHKMHGHITDASAHWAIKIEPELLREAGK